MRANRFLKFAGYKEEEGEKVNIKDKFSVLQGS